MSHGPESAFTQWLKKYRYINIALIYLGTALVVIHFAEAVVHGLHMPDITFSLIVVLALAGLPIVLLIAWALGHKKREAVETSITKPSKRNWFKIIIASALSILLFATAIFAYNKFFYHSKFTGKEKSIAVLPFANISEDTESQSFSIGISTEITNQLSKIGSLNVRASSSTIRFKDEKIKTLKNIAAELNVAAIVTGQFQKESDKILVHVALTDISSDKTIWTKSYNSIWKDIFSIQNEIAEQVAFELNTEMTKDEKKKIQKKSTDNPEAYKYYLQGIHLSKSYFETQKPDYFVKSKAMFEKALELDPDYAIAHAGLADLYNTYSTEDSEIIAVQLKEIERAWKLDSTNDYINYVKGTIEQAPLGNIENAFKYFKKAIELNPNSTDNLWGLAMLIWVETGSFDEAIALFNRVIKLDPLTAANFYFRGRCNFLLNKPENAIRDFETSIKLEPELVLGLDQLAYVYASVDNLDSAKKMIDRAFQLRPATSDHFAEAIAYVYAKLGNKKKSIELAPDKWRVLLALGMYDEALKAMISKDMKFNIGNSYLIFKSYLDSKDFQPIRNDERFLKIMESERKQYEENKKKFNIAGILN